MQILLSQYQPGTLSRGLSYVLCLKGFERPRLGITFKTCFLGASDNQVHCRHVKLLCLLKVLVEKVKVWV